MDGDEVFFELERTVDDLSKWLDLVGAGLDDLCSMQLQTQGVETQEAVMSH